MRLILMNIMPIVSQTTSNRSSPHQLHPMYMLQQSAAEVTCLKTTHSSYTPKHMIIPKRTSELRTQIDGRIINSNEQHT